MTSELSVGMLLAPAESQPIVARMFGADPIAAVATAPGTGAVALIRVSGNDLGPIAAKLFPAGLGAARRAAVRSLNDAEGNAVDHVVVTHFPKPHSYTGEDVLEIGCHGGVLMTSQVLETVLKAGARSAGPGEFTQRAFFNGKMDLTQAEAVMDVISAQTTLALRSANSQLAGRLGQTITDLRDSLLGILAHLEAYIDFPEEKIDPETGSALRGRMEEVQTRLEKLLATADQGRILRHGAKVVLCGTPNAGKSSLLNVLLGFDRAIVSPTPGTTRDTIEEVINLRGLPLRLIDTAGLRETFDSIEQQGVARSNAALLEADVILEIVDASQSATTRIVIPADATRHRLLVLNKTDLTRHPDWRQTQGCALSCLTREGIDALSQQLFALLVSDPTSLATDPIAINARHQVCLLQSRQHLVDALLVADTDASAEFIALEIRAAMDALGDIVGGLDTEDLLGKIFSQFCIGK